MKLSKLRQDVQKENSGVWVEWEHGIEFLIAAFGSEKMERWLEEEQERNRVPGKKPSKEDTEKSRVALMAHSILLDWRGVDGDNNQPLVYTPEEGTKVLGDPAYHRILEFITLKCHEHALYREEQEAEEEKN